MKLLFLDESGDHNLSVIDPQYPMFLLGGVIVDAEYADGPLQTAVDRFKLALFGRTDIILHTADIVRNRNGFEALKDSSFRDHFRAELNQLIESLDFSVVACAIRKEEHLSKYGVAALDPYLLSLDLLVERFCLDVGAVSNGGLIVAEKRNPTLDRGLDLAWLNLKIQGTRYVQARDVEDRILGLNLRAKKENIVGLQLADLVLTPIGRHLLGKSDKQDGRSYKANFAAAGVGKWRDMDLSSFRNERGQLPLRSNQPTDNRCNRMMILSITTIHG